MTGIDTFSWRADVDHWRTSARREVRAEHSLHGAVLLFVGELTRRKGVAEMLAALTALADIPDMLPWSVLCVGAGPLAKDLDRWAAAHPKVSVVRMGFVQPEYLPKYYAAADIFVLPSLEDVWGLVCLEALVAGLPQVTSSMVGAASDLVTSSDIGDIINPRDAQAFAQRLAGRIRRAPTLVPESARTDASTRWSPTAAAERGLRTIHACLEAELSTSPSPIERQSTDHQPAPDAVVTISVDDGHPSDRRAADLLDDLGYAATFYVPARNSERPVMVARDIRVIAERFEVGAHTVNHLPLTQLDPVAAYREIADGKVWLENIASTFVGSFCYPRGKFTKELARLVQVAGFTGARTTMGNIVSRPRDPFVSGSTTQAFSHSRTIQLRHAALERNWLGMLNYGRIFRFATDWVEHFERGVEYVAENGGVAHLWFHSWELDAYDQWGEVETLLRRLKSKYCFRVATNGEVFTSA
jgi:peptidoglycan/xylan/chitin deacetylase (PgdA/CDA1 family)